MFSTNSALGAFSGPTHLELFAVARIDRRKGFRVFGRLLVNGREFHTQGPDTNLAPSQRKYKKMKHQKIKRRMEDWHLYHMMALPCWRQVIQKMNGSECGRVAWGRGRTRPRSQQRQRGFEHHPKMNKFWKLTSWVGHGRIKLDMEGHIKFCPTISYPLKAPVPLWTAQVPQEGFVTQSCRCNTCVT